MHVMSCCFTAQNVALLLQVVIFVKTASRAKALSDLLEQCQFPACFITANMQQSQRLSVYK